MDKWCVIVNPKAAAWKTRKEWPKISRILNSQGIDYVPFITQHKGHGIYLATQAIEKGFDSFIAIGGDGTVNEIVNAIMDHASDSLQMRIGMIPTGTGNDWEKSVGIPNDYVKACDVIKQGRTLVQDVGIVKYYEGNEKKKRYFVNVAGLGFDAVVTKKANDLSERPRGTFSYLLSLFTCLMKNKSLPVEVGLDGEKEKHLMFSMAVGIGKYNGGGMMQIPHAMIDDGILSVTLVNNISKLDIILHIKMLYNGTVTQHPKIDTYNVKSMTLRSLKEDRHVYLEVDGESLGHDPFEFDIIKRKLNVVVI